MGSEMCIRDRFWTEAKARDAIITHLTESTYHKFTDVHAQRLAESAEIIEHEWKADEEDIEPVGGAPRSKRKARPNEPDQPPRRQRDRSRSRGRRNRDQNHGGGRASGSQAAAPSRATAPSSSQAVAVVSQELQDGIAVQTLHAISFVRAMTRAEKALKVAETVSRRAMETFQDMVASKGGCTCCGMTACGSTAKGFLDFL